MKISRLVKRRTIAKELCVRGYVKVNGKTAKPGNSIKVGDVIKIETGNKVTEVRVVETAENVKKSEAQTLYEIIQA